jgi:hypothetical protein
VPSWPTTLLLLLPYACPWRLLPSAASLPWLLPLLLPVLLLLLLTAELTKWRLPVPMLLLLLLLLLLPPLWQLLTRI